MTNAHLGEPQSLPRSGAPAIDFQALFDASPNPYVLLDPDFVLVEMNDAYLRVTMRRREDIIGRSMFEAFPQSPDDPGGASVEALRASLTRALHERRRDHLPLVHYDIPKPDGSGFEERFWSATHTPLFDEAGEVAYILQHTVDVTELHRLRQGTGNVTGSLAATSAGATDLVETDVLRRAQAVQETNRSLDAERTYLRTLFEQAPGFMAVLSGPDFVFDLANAAFAQVIGHRDVLGKPLAEAVPELAGQVYLDLLARVYETGEPFVGRSLTVVLQRQPGGPPEERAVDLVYQPILGPDGKVSGIFVQGHDITEQRQAQLGLAASHRQLSEVLESISDAFYAVDHDWRLTYVNRKTEELWGRGRDEVLGQVYWDLFPNFVGSPPHEAHLRAAREHAVVRIETISPVIKTWVEISIFPGDTGLSVYFRDITERKRAEEHLRLLINELNHRVKNTLAVVQAMAVQTLRAPPSLEEGRETFLARLLALAKAHDILTERNWEGANLGAVIGQALAPHGLGGSDRLALSGPDIRLRPKMALSLALVFHELATNAAKYGALAVPDGTLSVTWTVDTPPEGAVLSLAWRESGGPSVVPPARRGFGSRLIERSLAAEGGGRAEMTFEPGGVVCRIELPLPSE